MKIITRGEAMRIHQQHPTSRLFPFCTGKYRWHGSAEAYNRLHYLADRAGIRGRFSDADAYHLDQAFPLLMKQLELMLTSGELNPRHQHTITLYAKGLTCEADTLGSCSFVYMAVYATRFSNQLPKASVHQLTHYF